VKIVGFKGQYRITLPKDLVEDKGWSPGTQVRFIETPEGDIILKVVKKADKKGGDKK
jgi:AbrB family looped-hinge helix DNA binding protein